MMKLGKVIEKSTTTVIEIHRFDFSHMEWCSMPVEAEFKINDDPFGSGGFREAFKASNSSSDSRNNTWLVKLLSNTQEKLFRPATFALQLTEKVISEDIQVEYGNTFKYSEVFMGKTDTGDYVTIEEFIPGDFGKHINNNGEVCSKDEESEVYLKSQSLVHFSYEKS